MSEYDKAFLLHFLSSNNKKAKDHIWMDYRNHCAPMAPTCAVIPDTVKLLNLHCFLSIISHWIIRDLTFITGGGTGGKSIKYFDNPELPINNSQNTFFLVGEGWVYENYCTTWWRGVYEKFMPEDNKCQVP